MDTSPSFTDSFRVLTAELLGRILIEGPCTISELAAEAAVSRPTIRRALDVLARAQLVAGAGARTADSGRPAEQYQLGPGQPGIIGVDIRPGSTHIAGGTTTGRLLARRDLDHEDIEDPTRSGRLLDGIEQTLAAMGEDSRPVAIVLGVPGIVDADGTILLSRMIRSWTGLALRRIVADRFPTARVRVENDMNLRALAELHGGAAQGVSDFVYLTDHGWLRPVVVHEGRIRHGAHHALGEDSSLSHLGLVPKMLRHGDQEWEFRDVPRALEAGELDPTWLPTFQAAWVQVLVVVRYLLDPEVLVIDGPPATTGEPQLTVLRELLSRRSTVGAPPRILAGRRGQDVTLHGALTLALRDAITAQLQVTDTPIPSIRDEIASAPQKGRP